MSTRRAAECDGLPACPPRSAPHCAFPCGEHARDTLRFRWPIANQDRETARTDRQRHCRDARRAERLDGAAGGARRFRRAFISAAPGLANCTAGLPDVGLLTLNEVAHPRRLRRARGEDSRDRRCRYRFRRRGKCRAHDLRTGARRPRRLSSRRSGISQTLRSSRRQTTGRDRRDVRQNPRGRGGENAIPIFSSSRGPIRARWKISTAPCSARMPTSPPARMRFFPKRCRRRKNFAISRRK